MSDETQSWAVMVERNGEQVVTVASNHLSGRDLSAEDERVIRMAADHLRAFVGEPSALPSPAAAPLQQEGAKAPTEGEAAALGLLLRNGHAPPAEFIPWIIAWANGWNWQVASPSPAAGPAPPALPAPIATKGPTE